jgi:DNA helicase II / ATP-dependent DNA helicase PcrA
LFRPRKSQERVIGYSSGWMGVAAVPGSGKTQTLSALAAKLITEGYIRDDQEVLIVTLVNSAVENFSSRVSGILVNSGLLPGMGYRVRTLHGLAHDIVRERPDLAGLSNHFEIIDEKEADRILISAAQSWLHANSGFLQDFTDPEVDLSRSRQARNGWQDLAVTIAKNYIRQSKDMQFMPEIIQDHLNGLTSHQPLLSMGYEIFKDYQRALHYRSAVDFDDLIRLALQVLESDPGDEGYLTRLRFRWPFILEDEAQDSSNNQQKILRLLSGEEGNWVRVGDPNQAIFETFTTANPKYLIDFLNNPNVIEERLPHSGRSTKSVIKLANHLVKWTREEHPVPELRAALFDAQIHETPTGDPQPNPPDNVQGIFLANTKYSPEKEITTIASSVKRWMAAPENKSRTVAILVPRNERGTKIVSELKKNGVEIVELLQSSAATRETARILSTILQALSDPNSPAKLSKVYTVLRKDKIESNPDFHPVASQTAVLLTGCQYPETYFSPRLNRDWVAELEDRCTSSEILDELLWLRQFFLRWQSATLLPIDQLLLTISQDLFSRPTDLATAHKLALLLERIASAHPDWGLPDYADEIDSIARNARKFTGFSEEETGFDPDKHKGKVVVATIHKAKGLEWDRVYLLSANNYDFPSALSTDSFMSERWFVRGQLNLPEETLAKLKYLMEGDIPGINLEYGLATLNARNEYAAERLRLLYVGITRAKSELIITWNTGRRGDNQPALPLVELQSFWEMESNATAD